MQTHTHKTACTYMAEHIYPHTEAKHINTIALSSSFALMKWEKSSHRITDMPTVISLLYFIYFHLQTLIFLFIYRVCQTQRIRACSVLSLIIGARVHRSALQSCSWKYFFCFAGQPGKLLASEKLKGIFACTT